MAGGGGKSQPGDDVRLTIQQLRTSPVRRTQLWTSGGAIWQRRPIGLRLRRLPDAACHFASAGFPLCLRLPPARCGAHSYGRVAALFGSVARLGCGFEGFRMQLAISLQQDFHFAFGFLQFLAAGTGKFHALIEKLQRAIERDVPLLEFGHDFFQSLERLFKLGQGQAPRTILVHNGFGERKNLESIGCGGKYFLSRNVGDGRRKVHTAARLPVPSASNTSTAQEYLPNGAAICAPCTMWRTAASMSRAMATPSARAASTVVAFAMRAKISSGMETRSSFFMNSALRVLVRGQMPATTGMRQCSMRRRNSSSRRISNTGWVTASSAPASTLYSKRRISSSMLGLPGLAPTAMTNLVEAPVGLPPMSSPRFRLWTMLTRPMASTSKTAVASG